MAIACKGAHCPPEVLVMGVRWEGASPLSTRHGEERLEARGVAVAHAPLNRWGSPESPPWEDAGHRRQRAVWVSWRRDETDVKVQGPGRSRSRAVAHHGQTRDVRRPAPRAAEAAGRLLQQASRRHGLPETLPMDGRDAKDAARQRENAAPGTRLRSRQGP